METRLTAARKKQIREMLNKITAGEWNISGVVVSNGILTTHGDWPEQDDEANYLFLASSKQIVSELLEELDKLESYNHELQSMLNMYQLCHDRPSGSSIN